MTSLIKLTTYNSNSPLNIMLQNSCWCLFVFMSINDGILKWQIKLWLLFHLTNQKSNIILIKTTNQIMFYSRWIFFLYCVNVTAAVFFFFKIHFFFRITTKYHHYKYLVDNRTVEQTIDKHVNYMIDLIAYRL